MQLDSPRRLAAPRDDRHLLEGAPRLFAIVAEMDGDRHPQIVAWGHELPDQAILSWRFGADGAEVAVFRSAQAALSVAELMYPARLLWATPTAEGV